MGDIYDVHVENDGRFKIQICEAGSEFRSSSVTTRISPARR